MALVSYSDSEGPEEEQAKPKKSAERNVPAVHLAKTGSDFSVEKSNTRKIKVSLRETKEEEAVNNNGDGERAAKRACIGDGAFRGFNAMLPAPKRDKQTADGSNTTKTIPRKVFSLKTGAEPGFNRESDAELKSLFANREAENNGLDETVSEDTREDVVAQPVSHQGASFKEPDIPKGGNPMIFKPLSVARNPGKKKETTFTTVPAVTAVLKQPEATKPVKPRPKISLFFTEGEEQKNVSSPSAKNYAPIVYQSATGGQDDLRSPGDLEVAVQASLPVSAMTTESTTHKQSLDNIASDLNLSAAERRQLFGRKAKSVSAHNIVNFNTDHEYAANEALRASGEQVQHNPVRAIAPGKHSLKQLVSAASGQKDALEESFAAGKRNKKEAGSKYGW